MPIVFMQPEPACLHAHARGSTSTGCAGDARGRHTCPTTGKQGAVPVRTPALWLTASPLSGGGSASATWRPVVLCDRVSASPAHRTGTHTAAPERQLEPPSQARWLRLGVAYYRQSQARAGSEKGLLSGGLCQTSGQGRYTQVALRAGSSKKPHSVLLQVHAGMRSRPQVFTNTRRMGCDRGARVRCQ